MSVVISNHPVVRVALTHLRNKDSSPEVFRRELHRLSQVLAVEATKLLTTAVESIETPLAFTHGFFLSGQQALIPVMRAGSGMLGAFLGFLPNAYVWHVTISRDENTHEPLFHGSKIPKRIAFGVDTCFILDPMLATGGSACLTIELLKKAGATDGVMKHIVFVGVLGAPEGVERLQKVHPDVPIILGALDERLNENAYIVPGLGDAGDRLFPVEETV